MPGFRRWHPSEEPFSYSKLCLVIPVLVFAAALLVSWDKRLLPSSMFWGVAIVGLVAAALYFFFLKVVWFLLPAGIRARIPYDAKEASESKGDIRSFWDLFKLATPRSRG